MDFMYLYVMQYSDPAIYEIDLTNEEDDDIERILEKFDLDIDNCEYMYSNFKLKIEHLDNE